MIPTQSRRARPCVYFSPLSSVPSARRVRLNQVLASCGLSNNPEILSSKSWAPSFLDLQHPGCSVNRLLHWRNAFELSFQRDRRLFSLSLLPNPNGVGDNTMRQRAVPAATMIVAAGLIGITQARLPRPVRDYRDRVSVEMSASTLLETTVDWLGARNGAPIGRNRRL